MAYETIVYEVQDGVGLVPINRPKVLNALSPQVFDEIGEVVEQIRKGSAVRVVSLKGMHPDYRLR